jgi:molybdate transport system substrate-binding protein
MRRIVACCALLAGLLIAGGADAQTLTVFAAASLKNALDDVAASWKQAGGATVAASYASSSTVAKQIEQGAPADLFISADEKWMDYLVQKSLVEKPRDLLGNELVLIAGKDDPVTIDIRPGFDLAPRLRDGRRGGAEKARRVGQRGIEAGAGRRCAGGAGAGLAGRGAARNRL